MILENTVFLGIALYDWFVIISIIVTAATCVIVSKRFEIVWYKAIIIALTMFLYGLGVAYFIPWAESGFNKWGANYTITAYVYMPIFALVLSKVFKVAEFNKICDMTASLMPLAHGVGHFGCIFANCCHGYISNWGLTHYEVYNFSYQPVTRFPNQIIESIVSIAIAALFLVYIYRKCNVKNSVKYFPSEGKLFPVMLVLFGLARFLLEFLRDNEKLVLGISYLAFHALFMILVGIVWIAAKEIAHKHAQKMTKELPMEKQ